MSEAHAKSLTACRIKSASAPTPEQLQQIRLHTLRDFTAEELVVREYVLAHNAIDRDKECFAPALLDEFARTLPGKGVFSEGHPGGWNGSGGPAEGKVFAATTERMAFDAAKLLLREAKLLWPSDAVDAVVLKAWAYFVKTPANEAFLLKSDAGIGGDVSIGFNGKASRMKDPNGIDLDLYRWDMPGEALELSHVWLGAQPGARATKSASREETTMSDQNKQIADLTAERDAQKAAAEKNAKAGAQIDALTKALGADAKLLDDPAALVKALADGRNHRKSLIDALVAADRHAKLCGDDEAAVKAHSDMYDALPTEQLVKLRDIAEKRAGTGALPSGSVKPSDPNAGAPGAGTKAASDSPISNPAFAV